EFRVIGRVACVDGVTRDVYEDADGRQWVFGETGRLYDSWLPGREKTAPHDQRDERTTASPPPTGTRTGPGTRTSPDSASAAKGGAPAQQLPKWFPAAAVAVVVLVLALALVQMNAGGTPTKDARPLPVADQRADLERRIGAIVQASLAKPQT